MAATRKTTVANSMQPKSPENGLYVQAQEFNEAAAIIDNLTGNGTAQAITGTTGSFSGTISGASESLSGTLSVDAIEPYTSGSGTYIKKHVISAGSATLAPTVAQSGSVIALARAAGVTVTLPACATASIGTSYKFLVATTVTSGGYIINTTGTDVFLGGVFTSIAVVNATNDTYFGASTANKTITLNGTTTGGLVGSWVTVTMVSATQWMVEGVNLGTGTIATVFSN